MTWLLKKGKKFGNGYFFIKYHKNNYSFSCFSVVVSVKIFKSAVKRNRMRRQIYEIIRLNLQQLPCGYNIIVLAKIAASKLKLTALKQTVLQSLKNIH